MLQNDSNVLNSICDLHYVPLAYENSEQILAHRVVLFSKRYFKMSITNSQFLGASVDEFIQVWALGGNATLNLTTSGGLTKVAFNCTLGKPSDPHSIPPSPAPCTPLLPILTGHATVGQLRERKIANGLPATRQLGWRPLHQCPLQCQLQSPLQ